MLAVQRLDEAILLWIQSLRLPWLNPVMRFFSYIGDAGICWIVLCIILILFKKTRKAGVAALISLAVCFIINNLVFKNLFERTRPYEVIDKLKILIEAQSDASFPSGHACSSFATATGICRAGKSRWRWLALALAVLISVSRLYVGVHYLTDVLGGMAIGICGSLVTVHVLNKVKWYSKI